MNFEEKQISRYKVVEIVKILVKKPNVVNVSDIFSLATRVGMPRGYKQGYSAGYGYRARRGYLGRKRAARRIMARRTARARPWGAPILSQKAISNARIGGYLGIETKFYDQKLIASTLTGATDATGGEHDPSATVLMNTVVQGDGESNRDGRKITMKNIYIQGHIDVPLKANQTATNQAFICMIALVLDTQTNGATIASENVFTNPGASIKTAAQPFRNLQFTKRFRVLKRLEIQGHQQEPVWDGTNLEFMGYQLPFKIYVDLKNIRVLYSATTETVANITDNSLHLIAYVSNTGQAPTINYHSRLRFVG